MLPAKRVRIVGEWCVCVLGCGLIPGRAGIGSDLQVVWVRGHTHIQLAVGLSVFFVASPWPACQPEAEPAKRAGDIYQALLQRYPCEQGCCVAKNVSLWFLRYDLFPSFSDVWAEFCWRARLSVTHQTADSHCSCRCWLVFVIPMQHAWHTVIATLLGFMAMVVQLLAIGLVWSLSMALACVHLLLASEKKVYDTRLRQQCAPCMIHRLQVCTSQRNSNRAKPSVLPGLQLGRSLQPFTCCNSPSWLNHEKVRVTQVVFLLQLLR